MKNIRREVRGSSARRLPVWEAPRSKGRFSRACAKIKAADLMVFVSPLYFWTLSSRRKAFIERFYCIAEEDPNPPAERERQARD